MSRKHKIRHSDLPFGSEFSPSQIELPRVLEIANTHGGDWKAFENKIRISYFDSYNTNDYNKGKLANNTKLGMIAYGLIDRKANLTKIGRKLYNIRNDNEYLYKEFARNILLNRQGINLVQCVLDIQAAGKTVTLLELRKWLDERGIHFPRGGKHPSIMRLWLEKAGVFFNGWRVNEKQLEQLLGASIDEIEILAMFTPEQKAFLKTLANMGNANAQFSNEIEKLATATYGIEFNNGFSQVIMQEVEFFRIGRTCDGFIGIKIIKIGN